MRIFASQRNSTQSKSNPSLHIERLESRELLAANVVDVSIGSSQWDAAFEQHLQDSGLGTDGYRIPTGSTAQLAPVSWANADRLLFDFSEPVDVQQVHLQLQGVSTAPLIQSFSLESGGTRAVWEFASPLESDHYLVTLSDEIRDAAGNRLDGEWENGVSTVSGNGQPGGDFHFAFRVQVGDVNQDLATSVSDHGGVEAALNAVFGSAAYDPLKDIDGNGVINDDDLTLISSAFADRQPLGGHRQELKTLSVGDVNGNGSADIVTLYTDGSDGRSRLVISDTSTGEAFGETRLHRRFHFRDIEAVFDAGGDVTQIAALGVRHSNGGVRVWRWDVASQSLSGSVSFGKTFVAEDLEVIQTSGQTHFAVLGEVPKRRQTAVWIRDAATGSKVETVKIVKDVVPIELEVVDVPNGAPQLAVLSDDKDSGRGRVIVVETGGDNPRVQDISLGSDSTFIDLEILPPSAGGNRQFAVLEQTAGGQTNVEVRDIATGNQVQTVNVFDAFSPFDLEIAEIDGGTQFVVASAHDSHQHTLTAIHDAATGEHVRTLSFGAGFESQSIAVVQLAGETAIAAAQQDRAQNLAQVKLRVADDDTRLRTIPIIALEGMPEWFDGNRVQGHTRLIPAFRSGGGWIDTPEADQAAAGFADLGAGAFTRHAKSADEDPWWPSELPLDENGDSVLAEARTNRGMALDAGENVIQGYVNEAVAAGVPMIAYYFDATDARLAEAHPDWVGKDRNGNTIAAASRGVHLDITGPYGDIVLQRLLELADMGSSGIYLDFRHLPAVAFYGTQLEADFEAETGQAAPLPGGSALYQEYLLFQARRLNEIIGGWQQTIAEQYPHLQLIVSTTTLPALTRKEMSTELANVAAPKTEFINALRPGQNQQVFANNPDLLEPEADVRQAFGFALLRDAAETGLTHTWNNWMPNGEHVQGFISAVATYGGIAALDVAEELILPGGTMNDIATREELAAGFDLGNRISPHLQGTQAVRWAAVHFSENARDARGNDVRSAWAETIWPSMGAFRAIQRSGRSVGIVTDWQLEAGSLDGYQVLFLSTPNELTGAQQAAVNAFVAGGGVVINNQPSWQWSTAAGNLAAEQAFLAQLNSLAPTAGIEVTGGPERMHSVAYQTVGGNGPGHVAVAISNDFSWVQGSTLEPPTGVNPAAPPATGVQIRIDTATQPSLAGLNASEIYAYDAVSGQTLEINVVAGDVTIDVPQFAHMALVVVTERG